MKTSNTISNQTTWSYEKQVSLFKLVTSHFDKFDRNNWKMKYASSPLDFNIAETKNIYENIVEDLKIEFNDDIFNVNGCMFVVGYAISICDNLGTYESRKDEARLAALDAGFIDDNDLDYIIEFDNIDSDDFGRKLISQQLTPEQLVGRLDDSRVKVILTRDYPKYRMCEAYKAVVDFLSLDNKEITKKIKAEIKSTLKETDNAFTQLTKCKSILENI